jgi:hypothetical protein
VYELSLLFLPRRHFRPLSTPLAAKSTFMPPFIIPHPSYTFNRPSNVLLLLLLLLVAAAAALLLLGMTSIVCIA